MDLRLARTYTADVWDHTADVLEEATRVATPRRSDWDTAADTVVNWAPRPVDGRADFRVPELLESPPPMALAAGEPCVDDPVIEDPGQQLDVLVAGLSKPDHWQ